MIVDQLKAYCECVEDITDEDVAELVNVISLATGWQRENCETLLSGARREVQDLPSCADCPVTFEPYYHPFDIASFKFYLVKLRGIEEDVTEITDFRYISSEGNFRVDTGLPSCKCGCAPCGCPTEYKLLVEYEAGYDELPDCILPVFCNILEVIKAKRNCDCANDCGCENGEQKVTYASGDVVSVALETDIGNLLTQLYRDQLGMLVLTEGEPKYWGYVV